MTKARRGKGRTREGDAAAGAGPPRPRFRDAGPDDAPAMAGLHNAAAGALTARFGPGPWWSLGTERGALQSLKHARVRVGVVERKVVTVLRLARGKPWAIDPSYFTPVDSPLYLTGMTVSVAHQGRGLGRLALEDAVAAAGEAGADAIRLDAWDAEAGAGDFYARCGFAPRGRAVYRGTPLSYWERLIAGAP